MAANMFKETGLKNETILEREDDDFTERIDFKDENILEYYVGEDDELLVLKLEGSENQSKAACHKRDGQPQSVNHSESSATDYSYTNFLEMFPPCQSSASLKNSNPVQVPSITYSSHQPSASPVKNMLKCPYCDIVGVREFTLRRHIDAKHMNKRLRCTICNCLKKWPQDFNKHVRSHGIMQDFKNYMEEIVDITQPSTSTNKHKCPYCDIVEKTPSHLRYHLVSKHMNKRLRCTICNLSIKWQQNNFNFNFNRHMKTHHGIMQDFKNFMEEIVEKDSDPKALSTSSDKRKCPYCDFVETNLQNLRYHIDAKHTNKKRTNKQLQCTICNCSIKWPQNFSKHMKSHGIMQDFTNYMSKIVVEDSNLKALHYEQNVSTSQLFSTVSANVLEDEDDEI